MSSRKAIQCSVNLALIIAGLVVAVCYFTLLHPSILDYVTYKRLPTIQHRVSTPGGRGTRYILGWGDAAGPLIP